MARGSVRKACPVVRRRYVFAAVALVAAGLVTDGGQAAAAMDPVGGDASLGDIAALPAAASTAAPMFGSTIAAGGYHSLAVRSDGKVWAFGSNRLGQLGTTTNNRTNTANPLPTAVPGLDGVVAVAGGDGHTLVLRSNGTVWAFGYNWEGQLGNTTNNGVAGGPPNPTPTEVEGLTGVVSIAAGESHSLALRADGTVWAFGSNRSGQLGTTVNSGTSTANPTPSPVAGLSDVTAIAAGGNFSLALRSDGTVWAFGENYGGQLGNLTNTGSGNPNPTPTQVPGLGDVTAIAAGSMHSLARRSDGTVWSFGYNSDGQLGYATNTGTSTPNPTPTQVPGLAGVTALAAGQYHSLALRSDGTVWAFGGNMYGELGTSTNNGTGIANPDPTQVPGLTGVRAIAAGIWEFSLALRSDGTVWAFGNNRYGQLGSTTNNGTDAANPTPTQAQPLDQIVLPGTDGGLLRVATNPPVPSQIVVDDVPRDTWGLTWVKISPGAHTVCFRDVPGFATPPCQIATVTVGATTTVTGTFVRRGTLRVVTSPPVASTITVDGTARDDWGMWTDLDTGQHQVCFGAVAGFDPPPCQTITLTAGATTTVTGTFTENANAVAPSGLGTIRITTSPAVPSQITVDGVVRDTWGAWVAIAPGSHTVCFGGVEAFTTPACQTVPVTATVTTSVTGVFAPRGYLRVVTAPAVAATVVVDGVGRNDWGMWTDLEPGTYTVCFGTVPARTTPACQTATLAAGATATVTGTST